MIVQKVRSKLNRISMQLKYQLAVRFNWFDLSRNLDTEERIEREALYDSIDSENKRFMSRYVATDFNQLRKSLNYLLEIDKTVLDGALIDYGCGKGRVLLMAEQMGFKNVVGVEFSKQLVDICKRNLEKAKSLSVEVINGDAVDYRISGDARVFYFYNPFEFCIFEKVLENIKEFLKTKPYAGYIIYVDPRRFGRLDENEYELLLNDESAYHPFHVYRVKN